MIAQFKAHRPAFLIVFGVACFVGFLNIVPHIFNAKASGTPYYPYSLARSYDTTTVIAPRVRDVYDGHLIPSDTDLFEYKGKPAFWAPMTSLAYIPFWPVSLFVSDVEVVAATAITSDFVFSAILFSLLCGCFYTLLGGRFWPAVLLGSLASLFPNYSILIPPSSPTLLNTIWNSVYPLADTPVGYLLTRRDSFIPGVFPVLAALISLFLLARHMRVRYAILSGFFFALTAYTYAFHALYLGCALVLLFCVVCAVRDWGFARLLVILGVVGGVCLVPYVWSQYLLHQIPEYQDIFLRYGFYIRESFRFEFWERYVWSLILVGALWQWGRTHMLARNSYVVIALLLSGIAVLNSELVLLYSVQSDHWLTRELIWGFHLAYAAIAVWMYDVLARLRPQIARHIPTAFVVVLVCIIVTSVRSHEHRAAEEAGLYTIPAYYTDAFEWINTHTETDSVIVSPSLATNNLIPLYTHSNIYIPRIYNTLATKGEMYDRYVRVSKSFGIPSEGVNADFKEYTFHKESPTLNDAYDVIDHDATFYLIGVRYVQEGYPDGDFSRGGVGPYFPEREREELLNMYSALQCEDCLSSAPYRADYVLWGPRERLLSPALPQWLAGEEKVYEQGDVTLYKLSL